MEKLKRSLGSFAVPLLSILLAFLIGGIIMAALGADPFTAVKFLFQGAFGSRANIGTTLNKATPLMFTALCACFAYKCGVFNLGGEGQFRELELGALAPGVVSRIAEVVDQVMGELKAGQFEEGFPADTFGPVAQTFVLVGVFGVHFHDVLDRAGEGVPAGRFVGNVRHDHFGELGHGDTVGNLAADHQGDAVAFAVGDGQGGAHGVAVTVLLCTNIMKPP